MSKPQTQLVVRCHCVQVQVLRIARVRDSTSVAWSADAWMWLCALWAAALTEGVQTWLEIKICRSWRSGWLVMILVLIRTGT